MDVYKDLFASHHSQMDIMFLFKRYIPKKTQSDKETNDPHLFRKYTLNLLLENGIIAQFSKELNTTEENVIQTTKDMLNSMGYDRNLLLTRILGYITYKFYKKTIHHVYVLENPLIKLKQQMGNTPIVFLPNHRTYVDVTVMTAICFEWDIELPATIAGIGCLKIVVDLFNTNELSDIILLPITVQCDRVPEDELYAYEGLGKSKPKESSVQLLKAWYNMEENKYGNMYINTCEPISLRSYLEENKRINLDVLAHEIISSHRKNVRLTLFNLLATVLASRMYNSNENQFKLSEVIEDIRQLKNLLQEFGTRTNFINKYDDEMKELERLMKIHKSLVSLNDTLDTICIHVSSKNQLAGERPDHITLIMLQYYANCFISFVIDAIILISLLTKLQPINKDKLFRSYQFFRLIFKNEFVFHPHFEEQEFKKTIQTLDELNIISTDGISNIYLKCETNFQIFISNLLKPFQSGATFICELLLQNLNRKFSEKDLIKEIQKYITSKIRFEGYQYSYVYSTSSDYISNFIASLAKMKVLNLENDLKTANKEIVTYVCKESGALTRIAGFLNSYML